MKEVFLLLGLCLGMSKLYAGTSPLNKPNFGFMVAAGLVPHVEIKRKFGLNPDIDTGVDEDLWSVGGDYPFPSAAAATNVISSSVNDDVGGTGCTSIIVNGLNGDYEEISETVIMDGTTQVNLTNQFFRIDNAYCGSSGSGLINAGDIDIRHGTTVIGRVVASQGTTQQCVYTVPANHTWLIDNVSAGLNKKGSGSLVVQYRIKLFSTGSWRTLLNQGLDGAGSSTVANPTNSGRFVTIPAKTDIVVRVTNADSTNNEVNCNLAGYLVGDEFLEKAVY